MVGVANFTNRPDYIQMLDALTNMEAPPMAPLPRLPVLWLGRMDFAEAYALQDRLVAEIREGTEPEQVLLVEHDPVYTIGRTRNQDSLGELERLPAPLVVINRGGQATYHGPGQLVGYPMLDLETRGRDLHVHLRLLEELVIYVLAEYGVAGVRRECLTGVWVEDRKIASIGVGVRKGVSMHGFGLNVSRDLTGYAAITPCGIEGVRMTSLSLELGREVGVEEVAGVAEQVVGNAF